MPNFWTFAMAHPYLATFGVILCAFCLTMLVISLVSDLVKPFTKPPVHHHNLHLHEVSATDSLREVVDALEREKSDA